MKETILERETMVNELWKSMNLLRVGKFGRYDLSYCKGSYMSMPR